MHRPGWDFYDRVTRERDARDAAHKAFDRLWDRDASPRVRMDRRSLCYRWLAAQLDMPIDKCHFTGMGLRRLQYALEVCQRATWAQIRGAEWDSPGNRAKAIAAWETWQATRNQEQCAQ